MSSIKIKQISITNLETDCIVNAANENLWPGGGVCGAIFRAAGMKELHEACREIGFCKTGSAVITPGFQLKAPYIIHTVGPVWRDGTNHEEKDLHDCYIASLQLMKEYGCHSIGFPLISAGIYGYPAEEAWRTAIDAVLEFIMRENWETDVIFAVISDEMKVLGVNALDAIMKKRGTL